MPDLFQQTSRCSKCKMFTLYLSAYKHLLPNKFFHQSDLVPLAQDVDKPDYDALQLRFFLACRSPSPSWNLPSGCTVRVWLSTPYSTNRLTDLELKFKRMSTDSLKLWNGPFISLCFSVHRAQFSVICTWTVMITHMACSSAVPVNKELRLPLAFPLAFIGEQIGLD